MNRIVIEVTDALYKSLMLGNQDPYIRAFGDCVRSGTLLPKGHGRLIDADETIRMICGKSCGCEPEECGYDVPCYSVTRINSAPTIIEADGGGE